MKLTGLFVDDVRDPWDKTVEWTVARTFHHAMVALEANHYDVVSLDHDLGSFYGSREMTGYDILMWMVQQKVENRLVPRYVRVHSANPVAQLKMRMVIDQYF